MWVEISVSALMPASGQTVTDGQDMKTAASCGSRLSSECPMHCRSHLQDTVTATDSVPVATELTLQTLLTAVASNTYNAPCS
jgi:glycerate-2-kinase